MTMTTAVDDIFADARQLHASALERLAADDVRDAAEKAWCATKRAADALLLAKTGTVPETTRQTSNGLRRLAKANESEASLVERYYRWQGLLHGECFYVGLCEPVEDIAQAIYETLDYIADAERLAAG